jgi:hypothetical protein
MAYFLLSREILRELFMQIPVDTNEFPLFPLFGITGPADEKGIATLGFRYVVEGGVLKLRVYRPKEQYLDVVSADHASHALSRGTFSQVEVGPAFARGHITLTESEMSFSEVDAKKPSPAQVEALLDMLRQGEIRSAVLQTLHKYCVDALLGTATYTIDGATRSTSWGLSSIARPTVAWATAASATPIPDIKVAKDQFSRVNGANAQPDTIILQDQAWDWLDNADDTNDRRKYVEVLQRASLEGKPYNLMGLDWVFVRGRYAGADRWPADKIVLARFGNPAGGGVPTVKFETCRLKENDYKGGAALYTEESKDPVKTKLVASLNGVAEIVRTDYVQTWEVNWS